MTLHIVAFAGKDILDEALAFTASHLESMGFLDDFGEAEEQISKEGRTDCISYVIEVGKKLVQKWCNEGYFPKVEEYMQVSLVTTC
ncbi:hypothetical protein WN943_005227 [Citrus x changshan-huyou]